VSRVSEMCEVPLAESSTSTPATKKGPAVAGTSEGLWLCERATAVASVGVDTYVSDVSEGNEMRSMATMRRGLGGSVLLSAVLATSFITGPAASATTGEDAPVTGVMTVSCSGEWGYGGYQFGHYIGAIHVPSATQVTDAGLEAQCLLQAWHETLPEEISDPGAVDGIFGPLSQAAMADVQRWANDNRGGDLDGGDLLVDGFPGPQSWPQLRNPLLPHP